MAPPCGFEPMDDASVGVEQTASASVTLGDCTIAELVDEACAPLWIWRTPTGETTIGTGEAAKIVAEGTTRFGAIQAGLESLTKRFSAGTGQPRAFMASSFFEHPPQATTPWASYPAAIATVPSVQLHVAATGETTLTVVDIDGETDLTARVATERDRFEAAPQSADTLPAVVDHQHYPAPARWQATVDNLRDALANPPNEKVVLAGEKRLQLTDTPTRGAVVNALIDRHPDCWIFMHAPTAETMFVGATPERLVSVRDGRLSTVALAGTIARGETTAADEALRQQLIEREHTRHEQASVVGDIVSRLGGLTNSINVGQRRIRTLTDVQHIETPIEATLRDGVGLLDVTDRLHPTPAVGGRPRASALALIREHETIERGWYAAPIGMLDATGEGTLAVAIRSARIDGDHASLFAGNGIVTSSDPTEEWEELLLKFQAISEIFDG